MFWYEKETASASPVISTRVRFARNLENTPFPELLDGAGKRAVFDRVAEALAARDWIRVDFAGLDSVEKNAYVETHLASPRLAKGGEGCGLLLSRDGDASLMLNEEDHIRLQVILVGKQIRPALEEASSLAAFCDEELPIAKRPRLGYLTACPTNLGAGMRLSVMIHLPALTELGKMNALTKSLNDAGFTVRGMFGEGTRESGAIYQISNQMSREKTPEEIASAFEVALSQVEEAEWRAGQAILERDPIAVADRVCRAIGTLRYARRMSHGEFIRLYSTVRFGKLLGLEEASDVRCPDRLLMELMPSPMVLTDRSLTDSALRDQKRSETVRQLCR